MPKVSVYLPDELYRRARERRLSVSALTQGALERALRTSDLAEWIERERDRGPRAIVPVDSAALVREVRGEFGT